jgi:hypothetical protein
LFSGCSEMCGAKDRADEHCALDAEEEGIVQFGLGRAATCKTVLRPGRELPIRETSWRAVRIDWRPINSHTLSILPSRDPPATFTNSRIWDHECTRRESQMGSPVSVKATIRVSLGSAMSIE